MTAGLKLLSSADALTTVVEENVKAQVENLAKTITIGEAWKKGTPKGQDVWIHGWVYDLSTGLLRDLNISRGPPTERESTERESTLSVIPDVQGH